MLEVVRSGRVSNGGRIEPAHQISKANNLQFNQQKSFYFEPALSEADAQEGVV